MENYKNKCDQLIKSHIHTSNSYMQRFNTRSKSPYLMYRILSLQVKRLYFQFIYINTLQYTV